MDYINVLKKRLNILIGLVVLSAAVCVSTIIFYKPVKTDGLENIKLLESQREALKQERAAFDKLTKQQIENITYFNGRDSMLNNKLDSNIAEIKKVHNNEKINSISHYNRSDIVRAFADLAR